MKQKIISHLPGDHPWQNQIQWFDTIDSTNTRAKQLALSGAPHGTVLIAGHQSAGRGRMGRSFQSLEGMGVYMSVILRPTCPPTELMHLTCAAAVAACDAVEQAASLRPGIKWTNDLICGGRKTAGILTELVTVGSSTCAIIGIGVNCRQAEADFLPELRATAGSLSMAAGREVDPAMVAACLITAFYRMDQTLLTGRTDMIARYQADCITLGKDISLLRGDTVRHGRALRVESDGALTVHFDDGTVEAVQSGEVSVRGMYGYL